MISLRQWTLLLLCISQCSSFQPATTTATRTHKWSTRLSSSSDSNDSKPKGVYVRPSAVIEKGSGFFVPGLEGPRVRLFVGTGLLVATAVNHVFSSSTSAFSEGLSVFYSVLVLLQGAIESSKEGRIESIEQQEQQQDTAIASATSSKANLSQKWSSPPSAEWQDKVEWAAASFLSLTPATHMILLQDNSIQYWLGVTDNSNVQSTAVEAALTTIQQSKGGRVALPTDHPAATGMFKEETDRRCVILQRINDNSCWMVASNDLLASFTKQDLTWLGQLARYCAPEY